MPVPLHWFETGLGPKEFQALSREEFAEVAEAVFDTPSLLYGENKLWWNCNTRERFWKWCERCEKNIDDFVERAIVVACHPYNEEWIRADWSPWGVINYHRTCCLRSQFDQINDKFEITDRPKFDLLSVL